MLYHFPKIIMVFNSGVMLYFEKDEKRRRKLYYSI